MLFVGGCALMVFFFATGIIKQSDAYKIAHARAQMNPAVIEAIGEVTSKTLTDTEDDAPTLFAAS